MNLFYDVVELVSQIGGGQVRRGGDQMILDWQGDRKDLLEPIGDLGD
jgi:hypothetical protein